MFCISRSRAFRDGQNKDAYSTYMFDIFGSQSVAIVVADRCGSLPVILCLSLSAASGRWWLPSAAVGLCGSLPVSVGRCRGLCSQSVNLGVVGRGGLLPVTIGRCRSMLVAVGLCRGLLQGTVIAAGQCSRIRSPWRFSGRGRSLSVAVGRCRLLLVAVGRCSVAVCYCRRSLQGTEIGHSM